MNTTACGCDESSVLQKLQRQRFSVNFSYLSIGDNLCLKHQTGTLVLLNTCAALTFLRIVCSWIFQHTIPATVLTRVFCLSGLS